MEVPALSRLLSFTELRRLFDPVRSLSPLCGRCLMFEFVTLVRDLMIAICFEGSSSSSASFDLSRTCMKRNKHVRLLH